MAYSCIPGGSRFASAIFATNGNDGGWWSSTEVDIDNAWLRYIYFSLYELDRLDNSKRIGLSVRCLRD